MEWYEKAILTVLVLCFSFVIFLAVFGGKIECSSYEEVSGRETKHSWFAGCFVSHEGKYIPKEELVTINRKKNMEMH